MSTNSPSPRSSKARELDGLLKEAQREVIYKSHSSPARSSGSHGSPHSTRSSGSSSSGSHGGHRHHHKKHRHRHKNHRHSTGETNKERGRRELQQEQEFLNIIEDNGEGEEDEDFDVDEMIVLDQYEKTGTMATPNGTTVVSTGGPGAGRRTRPSSASRDGTDFKTTMTSSRQFQDRTKRETRVQVRDQDIHDVLKDPNGPNLMDMLQQRHEDLARARLRAKAVRNVATPKKPNPLAGTMKNRPLSPRSKSTGALNPTESKLASKGKEARQARQLRRLRRRSDSSAGGDAGSKLGDPDPSPVRAERKKKVAAWNQRQAEKQQQPWGCAAARAGCHIAAGPTARPRRTKSASFPN